MRVDVNHSSNAEKESVAIRSVSGLALGGGVKGSFLIRASTIACASVPASAAAVCVCR